MASLRGVRRGTIGLGLLAVLAAVAAGCGSSGGAAPQASTSQAATTATVETGSTDTGATEAGTAGGAITVRYVQSEDPSAQRYENVLAQSGLLEQIASDVDAAVALPRETTLVVQDARSPDLVYEPASATILVPIQWLVYLDTLFFRAKLAQTTADQRTLVLDATSLVVYHELGHALVDQLDLGPDGDRERAATDIATFLASRTSGAAGEVADGAATFASLLAKKQDALSDAVLDASGYWSTHFPDKLHFDDVVCWLYGSDPAGLAKAAAKAKLAQARLDGCADELAQVSSQARSLLGSSLR